MTDAMVQSHHDCMVVRVCQKWYVEAQQSVQFVSDGPRDRSFPTSFLDASECLDHHSEENIETEWLWRERKRRDVEEIWRCASTTGSAEIRKTNRQTNKCSDRKLYERMKKGEKLE